MAQRVGSRYCPYCQRRVATVSDFDRGRDDFAGVGPREWSAVLALLTCGLWLPFHLLFVLSMPQRCLTCGSKTRLLEPSFSSPSPPHSLPSPRRNSFVSTVNVITWILLLLVVGFLAFVCSGLFTDK